MRVALICGAAAVLAACTPTLNWREVSPPAAGVVVSFPCRPDFGERPASADAPAMGLAHCEAGGMSFALSWADLPEAGQVGPALAEMPRALASKLGAPLPPRLSLAMAGMTPRPEAGQYALQGPQGAARMAVFAHGLRVYQLLWRGAHDDAAAWTAFVEGLRLARS